MLPRFDAVLFDCDGVLVNSEAITNGVLHDMLSEASWTADRRRMHAPLYRQDRQGPGRAD